MRRFVPPVPRRSAFVRIFSGVIVAAGIALTTISAQIPGRNVNMVAGTEWPNGDPYLQRQNEPSIGASTRNPLHLLAGSNDYRTVDLPGLAEDETGDAWLGLYKSHDGGQRWTSTLLPGYPQDHSAVGVSSPIHGYAAGADPVVRAGTNGLMYYAGLAFDRANPATPDVPGKSAIFVSRFIDNNNKEAGETFEYLGTRALQTDPGGSTGNFLDKPWMVVDVPRDTTRCTVVTAGEKGPITQNVPAGPVYVAYTLRSTDSKGARYDVMFTRSTDCGATWTTPVKLNSNSERANQGAALAVDPRNGNVYIAWRQFDVSTNNNGVDALMTAKYTLASKKIDPPGFARKFAKPKNGKGKGLNLEHFYKKGGVNKALEAAELSPLDQSTSATQIRFRTNAYPTMAIDETGRVYLAWAERGFDPLNPDPVLGSARVLMATSTDGSTWTAARAVSSENQKGHQLMPSLTYAGGKLMLVYYDVRQTRAQSFTQYVDDKSSFTHVDPNATGLRHTIDLRASMASPGSVPAFAPSVAVSEYVQGPRIPGGPSTPWQVNPPNLPMFQKGTAPFIGDYVDIAAAPNFVTDAAGKWIYNSTAGATPPIFHAAWTDNRDVRVPLEDRDGDGNPWNDYTPPASPGGVPSIYDPTKMVPMCIPGNAGSRNQNIYTARITGGLLVGSPGNTKRLGYRIDDTGATLGTLMERSFVVFAQNTADVQRRFRFTITNQPIGGRASFDQFSAAPLTWIDADIPYRSTASRTVYATSTDPHAIINVTVQEVVLVNNAWVIKTGGLASAIILNPDIDNPDIDNPDIDNPDIDNPDIDNAEVYNPDIDNPDIDNPDIDNPDIDNPDIDNPDIDNIRVANPDIDNPDIDNPDIDNPDIDNPDIDNPDIDNPDIDNSSLMTDVSWSITNTGNTSASYNVNLFFAQTTFDPTIKTQLILYRTYKTPVVRNCELKTETRNVLVANVPNPQLVTGSTGSVSNPNDSAATNATIYLAPGEAAKITLRVFDPSPDPSKIVTVTNPDGSTAKITSAFVPNEDVTPVVQQQGVNTEDKDQGVTEPPPVVQFPPPQAADDEVYTTPNTPVTLNVLANDSAAFGSTKILSSHPAGLGQNLGGNANELIYMPTTNFVYVGSNRAVGVVDPVSNKLVGRIPYDPSEGPITWGIAAPRAGVVLFRTFNQGATNASILALDTRPTVNGQPNPTFHKFLSAGANQPGIDALGNGSTIGIDRSGLTAYYAAGFVDNTPSGANSQMSISAVNIDHGPGADFAHIYWTYPLPQGAVIRQVVQNPVTGKVYMATTGPNSGIYVIDPATPAAPARISGADSATTIAVNPAANLIVTAGVTGGPGTVYQFNIIDGNTHTVVKRVLPASVPGFNRSPRFNSFEDRLAIHYATGKVFLRTQSEIFILDAQPGSATFGQLSAGGPINVSTEFGSSDLVIDQQRGVVATTGNFRLSTFFIDAFTNAAYEKFQSRAGGELAVDELHGKIFAADFLNSIYTYTVPSAANATAVTLSVFPETTNAVVNPLKNQAYVGINDAVASEARFNGAGRVAGTLGINTRGRWGFGGWHDGSKRAAVINSGSDAAGQNSRPGSIAVIDGLTDQVLAEVNTVGQPFGLGINQSTGQVYVAGLSGVDASGSSVHGKIAIHDIANPATPFVDVSLDPSITALPGQLMSFARQVVVHPSTNKAYVALTGGSQTSVVYMPASAVGAPVTALPIDVTPSLPDVIVGGNLIAPKSDYRVDVIRVAPAPINRVYFGMVNNTAIAQGVLNAYQVVALNATTHQVEATYAGGSHSRLHSASWLAIDPIRNHLFVVDYEADKVTMLDASDLSFISEAALPDGPSATAINLASGHLYVSSVNAKAITALSTTTLEVLSSVKLPLQAFFIYPDEIESRIYTTGGNSPDESGVMIVTDVLGKLGSDVSVDDTPANGLKGTTVRNDDYSITYTPSLTAEPGDDHFTYAVRNAGGSATGDVDVHLVPAVESAVANGDAYATPQRWSAAEAGLSVGAPGVLSNDLSLGGVAQLVDGPQQASTFALNADGSFTYTPAVDQSGLDRFTYRIAGASPSNTVTVWLVTTATPSPTLVTNTNDSGAGSLRNAITYSNTQPGTQTISFAIPNVTTGTPALINVPTALPALIDSVVIDGSTQSAWDGRPVVEVRGPSNTAFAGFVLSANNITIKGLSITRFLRGVDASPGTFGHLIDSNHFGINRASVSNGNAVGVYWQAASSSIVNNVVSRNTNGMELRPGADNNFILGNKVGMGSNGAAGFGNVGVGIALTSVSNNAIGGTGGSDRNIIVGNTLAGVRIQPVGGGNANGNSIVGNWIGLLDGINTSGNNNSFSGAIFLDASAGGTITNTTIGGAAAARNVIAGNAGNGIGLYGAGTTATAIRGNYIGVIGDGAGGFLARPNSAAGVWISGASDNTVGGLNPGDGNVIAFNTQVGVGLNNNGLRNRILGNAIYSNAGLGIDIEGDNLVTNNDPGDGDGGTNNRQNFPVIAAVNVTPSATEVQGTLDSTPNTTFTVQLFRSTTCDASGYGEGAELRDTQTLGTGPTGAGFWTLTSFGPSGAYFWTVTATDAAGNTSEFSACNPALPSTVVTNLNDSGAGSLRNAINTANSRPGTDTITFNVPGVNAGAPGVISLASALPVLTQAVVIDGSTQPGFDGRPVIEVSGNNSVVNGFETATDISGVVIRNLSITRFANTGIMLMQAENLPGGHTVTGNYLGTDRFSVAGKGNAVGVIVRTDNSTINGNAIAGNTDTGIRLENDADYVSIVSNSIGIANGIVRGNGSDGIRMYDSLNNIAITGNVIAANGGFGIDIQDSVAGDVTATQIRGNTIGLDSASAPQPNRAGGIRINNAPGTLIGEPGQGNTISGNADGAFTIGGPGITVLGAPANKPVIRSNRIGLDISGTSARPNMFEGIALYGPAIVGGVAGSGEGNLIAGNGRSATAQGTGIMVAPGSTGSEIYGNIIGLNASGAALGNGYSGITVGESGTTIGATGDRGNVISGNPAAGIAIYPFAASAVANVSIQNNRIGTSVDGTQARPNGDGISVLTANNITIGSFSGGNTIAYNSGVGIKVSDNVTNAVRIDNNLIHHNGGLGIDLDGDGVTANDAGDADSGPNGRQNFPEFVSATGGTSNTFVYLDTNSLPAGYHLVTFFKSQSCDTSGYGEGEQVVIRFGITGQAGSIHLDLNQQVPAGWFVTATAMNDATGNSSEFSPCMPVVSPATITSVSPNPSAPGFGQLLWITGTNLPGASAADVIFNFGGNDNTAQHIWYQSPTLVIARFNVGTPVGNATVRIKSPDGSIVSNAFPISVQATPGAPIVSSVSNNCNGGSINSAAAGSGIWLTAMGIDSSGVTAVFTPTSPAGAPVEVASTNTCGNTDPFAASYAIVPAFAPGTVVDVQLKTTVNGNTSALSNASQITIADTVVTVGPAGGNGGSAFAAVDCPAGSVVIGLAGRAGDDIDQTQIVCAPKPALAPPSTLFVAGGNGGSDYGGALTCGAGDAVTGVFGATRGGAQIDYLGVTCTNPATQNTYNTGTVGLSQAPIPFALSCPAGKQVIGVEGRQGLLLDQISIRCK